MKDQKDRVVVLPAASDISERLFLFLVGSGLMIFASLAVPPNGTARLFLGAAAGFLCLSMLGVFFVIRDWLRSFAAAAAAQKKLANTACPAIVTDHDGSLVASNAASRRVLQDPSEGDIGLIVARAFGAGRRFIERLRTRAVSSGTAFDTLVLRGRHLEIQVQCIGHNRLLWRFDERAGRSDCPASSDCIALVHVDPEGHIIRGNELATNLLGTLPERFESLCASCDRASEEDGGDRVIVQIRDTNGWREYAILTAQKQEPQKDALLAEPGLLEALPVPMVKISADGALLEANHEARAILSLEPGPLPPLFELVEGMGRSISDWLADATNGRGLLKPEIVRAVRPGVELFLQITLGRAAEDGNTVLVGILNDATELKTLEAQFVQSQKMQAIGQLAGGVAHDFNNLLTAISGHCDLLLLRHDAGDPDYADLIQISQNSNRAASLVGQLLAFSRKQNLKPQSLDLRDTMSELAHLLNRLIGERIQLDVVHAPGEQVIRADRRQMEQVMVNLVVNARDAMPDGGQVGINMRREQLRDTLIRDRAHVPPGDYVVIEVKDTGTGIPADGLSKVFEPFYTTKKTGEGTGLGLSTAYGIVKQTGGYIFVESTPGKGTLFSLYFPAYELECDPVSESDGAKRQLALAQSGGVILLVEDEAPVRAFASRALQMRGYTVLEAENAEEALHTLADPDLHVDVFVTDVIMPGLDGPTWVRRALEDRPGTRTVFVSGYSEEGRIEQQSRIPNSVFLPKPFSLHQLTSVVNEQFH